METSGNRQLKSLLNETAFTLIELLVVISIISLLMGILLPALRQARIRAKNIINQSNQKQIVTAANCFAADNDERYPQSVATIGTIDVFWNWQEPTMMTGHRKRSPLTHRAVSEYLGKYISDADSTFCTNSPEKYKFLQKSWDAGDQWDNPETASLSDPMIGTYCYYWGYIGCLENGRKFKGPSRSFGGYGESKLLVSCYLGYDHWRSPKSFISCEEFKSAAVIPETWVSSAYWSSGKPKNSSKLTMPEIKLTAGFTDGHVESFKSSETIPMRVSITPDGSLPYPDGIGPGIVLLPPNK